MESETKRKDIVELSREDYISHCIKWHYYYQDEYKGWAERWDKTAGDVMLHKCKDPDIKLEISHRNRYFANFIFNRIVSSEYGMYDNDLTSLTSYDEETTNISSDDFVNNTCDNCLQLIVDNKEFFDQYNLFDCCMEEYIQNVFKNKHPKLKYLLDDYLSGKHYTFPYPFEDYPEHEIKTLDKAPSQRAVYTLLKIGWFIGYISPFDDDDEISWDGSMILIEYRNGGDIGISKVFDTNTEETFNNYSGTNIELLEVLNSFNDIDVYYCKIIDYHLQKIPRAADFERTNSKKNKILPEVKEKS